MTRKSTRVLAALAGAAAMLPATAGADLVGPTNETFAGPASIGILLDGSKVNPGPGSRTGEAVMGIDLNRDARRACFKFEVHGVDEITGATLHKGGVDDVSPVRLTLFEAPEGLPGEGYYRGCVDNVKRRLIKRITKIEGGGEPQRKADESLPTAVSPEWVNWTWYVQITSEANPDGAIRGQLGAGFPAEWPCRACAAF